MWKKNCNLSLWKYAASLVHIRHYLWEKKVLTMVLEKIQLVHGWDMIHADNAVHVMHDFIAHNIEKGGKAIGNLLIHIN